MQYNVFYEMVPKINGYSQCIIAACVEMSTIYTNNIVECFEARLKSYLLYTINKLFDEVSRSLINVKLTIF